MGSSSTFTLKRTLEPWTEDEAKGLCDRAQPPSLMDDVSETNISQVLTYEDSSAWDIQPGGNALMTWSNLTQLGIMSSN